MRLLREPWKELGSPHVQVVKGVVNALAIANMGNSQQIRLAQCVQ